MPIVVSLSSPELAELVSPHTSRLVNLTIRVNDSRSCLSRIVEHLCQPIPTLHTLRISTDARMPHTVELASDIRDTFFVHSKKLVLEGVFLFRGPPVVADSFRTFPHVTEIALRANDVGLTQITDLLDTLEWFPMLERASITLGSSLGTPGRSHFHACRR